MENLVFDNGKGTAVTNSLLVAKTFGKAHRRVMQDVRNIGCSEEFRQHNFVHTSYVDTQGREQPLMLMTRDGFTILVMGYTGTKAVKFKEEYIAAFNKMESQIKENAMVLHPKSNAEMLLMYAQQMVENERRLKTVEAKVEAMEKEREENGELLLQASVSQEMLPSMSVRDNIRQLVNRYSTATNTAQQDVWHKIYDQLYYLYHIHIKGYKKDKRETYLDVAERNHFIDKIYNIISNLVRECQERKNEIPIRWH